MLANGLVEPSFLSSREVVIYYSAQPEFFVLPNGALFMSESLLERILKTQSGGLEALSLLIVHELGHIVKGHLGKNLSQTHHYGDLKNQLFYFSNEYTGYDALFIDHFTNTRYTLEQEVEADELAWVITQDLGLLGKTDLEGYLSILKAV